MPVLTLYSRTDCHLCEQLLSGLQALCAGQAVQIEMRDVDTDPVWQRRYGLDVPLLFDGDEELCRHVLDPQVVQACLARHATQSA